MTNSITYAGETTDFTVCRRCGGHGTVALNGVHAETLAYIRADGYGRNGAEWARLIGCEHTAMNNRLDWLEKHGFLASRQHGKSRIFWAPRRR